MAGTFGIDGVISGLKTQDIISQLMALERQPLTLLQQKIDQERARLDAVTAIKTQFTALRTALSNLLLPSTLNAKAVTTDTPSGTPPVLTATANAQAANGSFKVTVSQIATATRVQSSGPLGQVIDPMATLANAGFRLAPITEKDGNPATFSINGQTITIDSTTTLDDGTSNSVIAKINAAGAGVTASLVADAAGRAANRIQLVSDPGRSIQLGSGADTSNLLRVLNLADAVPEGYTAAQVTSGTVAAGALSTSIVINGVTTVIEQTNASFTAQQNAAFIVDAINAQTNNVVRAIDNGDGTFRLEQKTLGSQQQINITTAGVGTGLSTGVTQNGTDRVLGTMSLGAVDTGKPLGSARLVAPISGLDVNGNGKFAINGVEITYNINDSLNAIISRINASSAGVTATYDPVQDRLRLTATQTGARTIGLADVTGNFLAATGLLGATQTLGQNAVFTIDTVNNGQPLTSSSNTVTGYVPGVTLELKSVSATPVTVTVGQDTTATANAVRTFVDKFNAVLDAVRTQTQYDAANKRAATLTGDSAVLGLERMLRSLVSSSAVGLSGRYRSLADLGISTGPVGSAVGSTQHLVLDEAKLAAALQDNPQAVQAVFTGFAVTFGSPTGAGNITAISGTPLNEHEDGTYHIKVLDGSGNVEVRFVTTDGRELLKTTGTLAPGQDNTTLIPGVTLRAAATLTVGEDTATMTVATRGVGVRLNDYLRDVLGADGFFANRDEASQEVQRRLSARIAEMEAQLEQKQEALQRRFTALEVTLSQLQAQSNALAGQIARLLGSTNQ